MLTKVRGRHYTQQCALDPGETGGETANSLLFAPKPPLLMPSEASQANDI